MGNDEFNALAFHTQHPDSPGTWLRPRNNKNIKQHLAFLSDFLNEPAALERALNFFRKLPLWLDLPGIRVVHACWDNSAIARLESEHAGSRMT